MRSRRRVVAILAATLVVAATSSYLVASAIVWDRLTAVRGDCPPEWAGNDPASFELPVLGPEIDASEYAMADAREVRFGSRTPGIEIAGWWVPSATPDAPAVVVVHGRNSCRRSPAVLLPAGMLWRNGHSVLLIDLRDHGDSTLEDGRYAGGTEEYLDVLSAWDWLRREQGLSPSRIGLLGTSLGAASVLIAAGAEPDVAAVWEDSSYADISAAIRAALEQAGYPSFLDRGGVAMARLLSGDDLASRSPLDAVRRLAGRPLFVTHGTADRLVGVEHGRELVAAAQAAGSPVESLFVEGADHLDAMFTEPGEYEARLVRFFRSALP